MDELRFRSQQSPRNDQHTMNSLVSPPRNSNRHSQNFSAPHDPRSTLPRRFTTDSGRVPTLTNIAPQRGPESQQGFATDAAIHKVQLLEKKRMEYEKLREQKRRFEAEMQKLDLQQRREEQELAAMTEDLGRIAAGHQSEPTTPPEYRDPNAGFPNIFSRPNRYSTSSLVSPPGLLYNRPGRSGSQLASPQSGGGNLPLTRGFAFDDQLPARSMPGTRRNSDEDEKEEAVRQDPTSHRSTNALNRYSMPVTRSRTGFYDLGLDQTNTTRFLFGDEDNTGDMSQFANTDESFPTLTRHEMSAAELQMEQGVGDSWSQVNRHRQQSLSSITNGTSSAVSAQQGTSELSGMTAITSNSSLRRSFDIKSMDINKYYADTASDASVAPAQHVIASPPKLQSSYSANDVPTVKSAAGTAAVMGATANNHANQHFHNHNASIGRIPAGVMHHRHSRELSGDNTVNVAVSREGGAAGPYASIGSALHTNAMPYGAGPMGPVSQGGPAPAIPTTGPAQAMQAHQYSNGGFFQSGGQTYPSLSNAVTTYPNGLPLLATQLASMSLSAPSSLYPNQNYTGYGNIYTQPATRDSQARVIQNRRALDNEAMNRFNNLSLEQVGGTIYELCKDQHGCRYLQKQLENRQPEHVHMIWLETNQHVVELMTDPFGNYLCQKLLEYCNEEERTVLIQNASQDMVRIALNQHGTRALQKMIEFINTDEQVQIIIESLRNRVVELIQDLNGNHVIQKCLNKLNCTQSQFIFDAVGKSAIDVGTHRHGCCVLQRCIDHASGDQKVWLIQRITEHAVALVQDPFGNYVVQYIIDLNEPSFTEPLVGMFRGRISALSRHKFSSNVIEKCLRCAQDGSKDMIAEEILAPGEIERLLRDSFANYVIQTALEYSTHYTKHRLVDAIRPILPNIRATPYGRRIQAKIQAFDSRSGQSSGQVTPSDSTQGQIPVNPPSHNRTMGGSNVSILASGGFASGITLSGLNGAGNGVRGSQQPSSAFPSSNVITVPALQQLAQLPAPSVRAAPQFAPPQYGRINQHAQQVHQPQGQQFQQPAQIPSGPPGMGENGEQTWV
ncbi:RNA-binding protein [Gaeumannomyces tritici R3-111a-1]|uniref:RNA-binding protein n=1 Tax=Gaeumannomyces tritici (strain R3-111a-1) TaxID=644352 RepID=J3PB62_GAET3|nr:RNA-binding protein [Gaeumannomyces tritici R3-111a-1]EJT71478.1 RNA-binding protein [Gaeumannomyces tritici R3-111a-1]